MDGTIQAAVASYGAAQQELDAARRAAFEAADRLREAERAARDAEGKFADAERGLREAMRGVDWVSVPRGVRVLALTLTTAE